MTTDKTEVYENRPILFYCFYQNENRFLYFVSQAFQTETKPIFSIMAAWENESFLNSAWNWYFILGQA